MMAYKQLFVFIFLWIGIYNLSRAQSYLQFQNIDTAISQEQNKIIKTVQKADKSKFLLNLVHLFIIKGNYKKAFTTLEEIPQDILNKNHRVKTRYLDFKGLIFFNQSDVESAKTLWDQSFTIKNNCKSIDSSSIARTYDFYSKYYSYYINKQKAYNYGLKALNILRQIKENSFLFIETYRDYSYSFKIYKRKNDFWQSIADYQKMLDTVITICKKNRYNFFLEQLYHDYGNSYTDIVSALMQSGKKQEAKKPYNKAHTFYNLDIAIRSKYFGKNNTDNGITFFTLGLLEHFSQNSRKQELEYYNKALQCYYPDKNKIMDFDTAVTDKYQVLQIIEYKTDVLLSLYRKTSNIKYLFSAIKVSKQAISFWQDVLTNFKSFEISKVLSIYYILPFRSGIKISTELFRRTGNQEYLNQAFEFSELEKHAILTREILKQKATLQKNIEVISLDSVQKKLQSNQAIIEYGGMEIFLIKKDTTLLIENNSRLDKNFADSLTNAIVSSDITHFAYYLHKFYKRYFEPVKKHLNQIADITIIPSYNLGQIPFDCLIDSLPNGKSLSYKTFHYLIQDYKISYAFSATLKYASGENQSVLKKIYGLAPYFTGNSSLPFSQNLFKNLATKYAGNFVSSVDTSFFTDAGQYSIIHLATHEQLDTIDNMRSKILTSNLQSGKYVLLSDFYKHKLNTKLAIFLTCESSVGKAYYGDQANSFLRALRYAGVPATITTLWKVDDQTSNQILSDFYHNLIDNKETISTALHHAKMNYLAQAKTDDDFNPYYWAGIIFTGSDIPINIAGKSPSINYWLIALISLLVVIFFLFRKKN